MPYENIYIKQVAEHPHIYSDEELMHAKKGKWLDFFAEQKKMNNEKCKMQNEGSDSELRTKNCEPKTGLMLEIGT
jgi:hypothetical protein